MHNLVEANVFDAAISVPDDGVDFRTAASLYAALQSLTNRTRALFEFLAEFSGTVVLPASLSVAASINAHGILTASDIANLHGAVKCYTTLEVDGATTCTDITADSVSCLGGINTSTLTVTGTTALQTVSCVGLTASNTCAFYGGIAITGLSTLAQRMLCAGPGRVFRPGVIATSLTTALDQSVATDYCYPTTLSADTTATITDSLQDGDEVFVSNFSTAHTVQVNLPGGSALGSPLKNVSGSFLSYRIKRMAGVYTIIDYSKVP